MSAKILIGLIVSTLLTHCGSKGDKDRQTVYIEEHRDTVYTLANLDNQLSDADMQIPASVSEIDAELASSEIASMFILDSVHSQNIDFQNPLMQEKILAEADTLRFSTSINLTDYQHETAPPQDSERFEISYVYYVMAMNFQIRCPGKNLQAYHGMALADFMIAVKQFPPECVGSDVEYFSIGKKEVRYKLKPKDEPGFGYLNQVTRDSFSSETGGTCKYRAVAEGWIYDGCMQILDFAQLSQEEILQRRFMFSYANEVEIPFDTEQNFYTKGLHSVWINGWQGAAEHHGDSYDWYITDEKQESSGRTTLESSKVKNFTKDSLERLF